MHRILILSAWEPEVASLRRILARPSAGPVARTTVCRTVGVGAVDAGIGAARAIADVGPTQVVFIGTAGSYPGTEPAPPIGGVAIPEAFVLSSTAALRGDGYTPAPMTMRESASATLRAELELASPGGGAYAIATSPLAITRTAALARQIASETGASVENLEVFAVARAAAAHGVAMAALLGVTNRVGPKAHAEWRRHHQAVSRAACAVAWNWLRARGA